MVLGQAVDVVIQGVEAGGGDVPGLAQGAAPALLEAPGLVDVLGRAGQHGAGKAAEALGEIDPDGIVALGVIPRRDSGADAGIEEAGAVHVGLEAVGLGFDGDLAELFQRPDAAAEGVDHDAAEGARPAGLEVDDVGRARADRLAARLAMQSERNLVAHGAGGQQHRGLLAEQVTDAPA
jgi:hypothetical protein